MRGLGVCGLGRLGSPIAAVFAASGVPTVGYDMDQSKIDALHQGRAPVDEPELQDYLEFPEVKVNLRATANVSELVALSDACIFVTQTPSLPNGDFSHECLFTALMDVGLALRRQHRTDYTFIVTSTVMPGFLGERALGGLTTLLGGADVQLAYKPEFIALGTVIADLHNPSMLMVGANQPWVAEFVENLYRLMVVGNPPAYRLTLVEAELAKISVNCAITAKISFANQVGDVAARLGADPVKVLEAVGADRRIGPGALRFGGPFAGPCFPRDGRMFQRVAKRVGVEAVLANAVDTVNQRRLRGVLAAVPREGDVGILGMAYKPGTSVTEESAGMWWRHAVSSRGQRVKTHDPLAAHGNTIQEVLDCPTVIIACAWPEYQDLQFRSETLVIDAADGLPRRASGAVRPDQPSAVAAPQARA